MPFSSLSDPIDVARVQAALDTAWKQVCSAIPEPERERERTRLAYIIASFSLVAINDDDLVARAVNRFRKLGP